MDPFLMAFIGIMTGMSIIALITALFAAIEVKAMQKSTHSIQYVPATPEFEKISQDLEQKLNKDIFESV